MIRPNHKQPLTVLIRSWGEAQKDQIGSYINNLYQEFDRFFDVRILLATNISDPILEARDLEGFISQQRVEVVFANLKSFSDSWNKLLDKIEPGSPALTISTGIQMKASQVIEAYGWLGVGAWAYGWQIQGMGNDGQAVGKGWYNTAALLHPDFIKCVGRNKMPLWIDNGIEGSITIGAQDIPIGGGEETVMMHMAIQENPAAYFILNSKELLQPAEKTGTEISYTEKMLRKERVAQYYLEKLKMSPSTLWEHLFVLTDDGILSP